MVDQVEGGPMDDYKVPPDAGKQIVEAAAHIAAATKAIGLVVVSRCPGSEELPADSLEQLLKVLTRLVRIRQVVESEASRFEDY
jgi:hypothetical protein